MIKFSKYAFAILAIATFVVGCSSRPGDDLAAKHIEANDTEPGVYRVANIVRKNGWEDGANLYKVEYTYDRVADADYADAVLNIVAKMEKDPESYFPSGLGALQWGSVTDAALSPGSGNLFSSVAMMGLQGDENGRLLLDIGKRIREGTIGEKLADYIKRPEAPSLRTRQRYVLFAALTAETEGLKPSTKKGEVVQPRQWTLTFRRAEKGWQIEGA